MAYGTPADPVSGTVITVSYAVANLLNPIRWLRQLTGGSDPPGSGYVVASTSTALTNWQKVTNDLLATDAVDGRVIAALAVGNGELATDAVDDRVLAAGAAVANLGYTPAALTGAAFTGPISVTQNVGTGNNLKGLDIINTAGGNAGAYIRLEAAGGFILMGVFIGNSVFQIIDGNGATALNVNQADSLLYRYGHKVWDAETAPSAADVNSVQTRVPGTGAGNLAILGAGGKVALAVAADTASTATNFSGSLSGDVTGTQSATVVASKVPSGAIVMHRQASEIATGWTRESSMDGRIPVGDGSTFSQTFVQGTNYGADWTPSAGLGISNTMSATSSAVAASGSATQATGSATATLTTNVPTHTHPAPTITLGGSVSITGASSAWLPPMRSVVYARKN